MAPQGARIPSRYVVLFIAFFCSHCVGIDVMGAEDKRESSKTEKSSEDGISYEEGGKASAPEEASATSISRPQGESVTDDCIKYVNFFRAEQMSNPLPTVRPHKALENYIKSRMDEVAQRNCSEVALEMPPGIGATFYATSGTEPSCKKAAYSWYRQIREFHGIYPGRTWEQHNVGQFSQMMWDSSVLLACARTRSCTKGFHQLACLYYPAGNVLGDAPFSEEVWRSLVERHAKWTGVDVTTSTRTTTTTEIPADPSIPYLIDSLKKAVGEKEE